MTSAFGGRRREPDCSREVTNFMSDSEERTGFRFEIEHVC